MTGPRLLAAIAVAIVAMCVAIVATVTPGAAAAHAVVRWTARTSLVLFSLAYVARPAVQLAPSAATRRLLAQRKWVGLGFATSHAAHLVGIIAIAWPDPSAFVRAQDPSNLVALAMFGVLGAMAVTSIERVKRAMSRDAWKRLHRIGMHLGWFIFAISYAGRLAASPLYALPFGLVIAIAVARVAAWRRGRRLALARA